MKIQYYAGLWLAAILFCACGTRKAAQTQALQPAASELVNSLTQIQLPPEEKQIPSGGSEKTPQQNTQPQLPVEEG
ncbi:MAG: hypothetical protein IKU94_03815, partial [Bacteroidaceae bacterium]|nr:hypothetical protein [Bacteroidaceae bacterium]